MASKGRGLLIILLVILVVLVGAGVFLWPQYEGQAPRLVLEPLPTHLGRQTRLVLKASDQGRGLAYLAVFLRQGGKEVRILEERFPPSSPWAGPGVLAAERKLEIEPLRLGLAQGKASLVLQARDRSFRNWLRGNATELVLPVTIDSEPPRLGVLSGTIYMVRGGSALAVYQVSPDAVSHGVKVGGQLFRGYRPWPKRPGMALCLFAYGQDLAPKTPVRLWARDAAGNQGEERLPLRLRWRRFRHDKITLSSRAVGILARRFAAQAPAGIKGDLAVFTWINTELRKLNHQKIKSLSTSGVSDKPLWDGALIRPQGKPTAGFGDRRTYLYRKKEISKAVHLGVDLADVAHSPIKAAAAGKVLWAGPLGIYGNCVILDHGLGLATLYGHLSRLEVKAGDAVKSGQVLGRSGATGLALGDHLHFSVLVGGVYVNPREWWDPHWIESNLDEHLKEAGLPWP